MGAFILDSKRFASPWYNKNFNTEPFESISFRICFSFIPNNTPHHRLCRLAYQCSIPAFVENGKFVARSFYLESVHKVSNFRNTQFLMRF